LPPFLVSKFIEKLAANATSKKIFFPISGKKRRKNKYFAIPFTQILVFTQLDNIQDDLSSMTEHYGRLEAELQQKDEKLTKQREVSASSLAKIQAEVDALKQSRDELLRQLDVALANQENVRLR